MAVIVKTRRRLNSPRNVTDTPTDSVTDYMKRMKDPRRRLNWRCETDLAQNATYDAASMSTIFTVIWA
jgi:ribosome-binding protein aMBF1 (putative translation factor)